MATTSNYGWTIPDDTDLVKNGALAIRTLGNAIDTTAAASFNTGLVYIGTTNTGGAVSSVSIDDVFSADYVQYKIIFDLDYSTTHTGLSFRLRVGGVDNTGNNYVRQTIRGVSTTVSASNTTATSWGATVRDIGGFDFEIFNPFATKNTLARINSGLTNTTVGDYGLTTAPELQLHKAATSYDGFTVFPQAGTIDGKISVLGYKI